MHPGFTNDDVVGTDVLTVSAEGRVEHPRQKCLSQCGKTCRLHSYIFYYEVFEQPLRSHPEMTSSSRRGGGCQKMASADFGTKKKRSKREKFLIWDFFLIKISKKKRSKENFFRRIFFWEKMTWRGGGGAWKMTLGWRGGGGGQKSTFFADVISGWSLKGITFIFVQKYAKLWCTKVKSNFDEKSKKTL